MSTPEAQALLDSLRSLRKTLAGEQQVPAYAIFADRTLLELACYRPGTTGELYAINGLGDQKIFSYGTAIVEVLQKHEELHGRPEGLFPIPEDKIRKISPKAPEKPVAEISASALETLELFEDIQDVDKVAEERGIKVRTVYSHLTSCVESGKLEVDDVVDFSTAELECLQDTLIFFKEEGLTQLSPVYNALFGNYSFELLRLIRAGIK